MKTLLISILALTSFSVASAEVGHSGFECKDGTRISKNLLTEKTSTPVIEYADGKMDSNPLLILPEGSDTESYQERFGTYLAITSETTNYFPYMPEPLMIYHMSKSQKLYRKGFPLLDDMKSDKRISLSDLYCKALIQSILGLKP